jgi:hypothetical protein
MFFTRQAMDSTGQFEWLTKPRVIRSRRIVGIFMTAPKDQTFANDMTISYKGVSLETDKDILVTDKIVYVTIEGLAKINLIELDDTRMVKN